jgi:hypothetical protein
MAGTTARGPQGDNSDDDDDFGDLSGLEPVSDEEEGGLVGNWK